MSGFLIFLFCAFPAFGPRAYAAEAAGPRPDQTAEAAPAGERKPLVISSKVFMENVILGEMLAVLLEEKYGLAVSRRLHIGGTKLVFEALKSGQADVYPEYTGTGYIMILKQREKKSPEAVYAAVKSGFLKKFQMIWSPPLGFENTYALAVRADDSRLKDIKKISRLKGRERGLSLAAGHEFMERQDGYDQFARFYGLHFPKNRIYTMNPGLMYTALKNGGADMIMSYSTDGRLKLFDFRLLEDDRGFFPSYKAAYLTRASVLKSHPELGMAFKDLEGKISQREMTDLNDRASRLKQDPALAARRFLIKKGILGRPLPKAEARQSLADYYLSKKSYFLKILKEHLILTFSALFFAMLFAFPLGVWSARKAKAAKIVFPIVNTLQTVPGLALLGFCIPFLGIGFAPAVFMLFVYSLLPLIRNTYEGIKAVEGEFIEEAFGLGLTSWQVLRKVELPLALPFLLAGLRTSAVVVVGAATLAALVGAGGLGDPVFRGIASVDSRLIFLGAAPAAGLAVALDRGLGLAERLLVSPGLRLHQNRQKQL